MTKTKPKLLLIPGVLCDYGLWQNLPHLIADVADVYHASIPRQDTISQMTFEALRQTPEPCIAVGFSLGGWIALQMAHLEPSKIQGLILISTSNGQLSENTQNAMRHAIQLIKQDEFAQYIEKSCSLYLTKQHANDPKMTQQLTEMMLRIGPTTAITQYSAILKVTTPFGFIDQIRCPVKVISGRYDRRHSLQSQQAFANEFKNAQLQIVEDAAHFVPIEQPELLARIIRAVITQ